ncbi:MAG: VOC family protein [Ginsengibacter sp.]
MKLRFAILLISLVMAVNASNAQTKPLINHIAVYVVNLETSTNFYRDIIGLEIIPEPFHDGRHTWFSVGDHAALHLISGAKVAIAHDKDSHLCFSVAAMEPFIAQLEKNKVAYENWPGQATSVTTRADGVKQIYFKDPDGYWIEINNDRK